MPFYYSVYHDGNFIQSYRWSVTIFIPLPSYSCSNLFTAQNLCIVLACSYDHLIHLSNYLNRYHLGLQENWEVCKLHTPIISVTKQQCFCRQRKGRQMDARITFLLLKTYIRVLSLLLCSKTVFSR